VDHSVTTVDWRQAVPMRSPEKLLGTNGARRIDGWCCLQQIGVVGPSGGVPCCQAPLIDFQADDHVEKRLLRISEKECMAPGDILGLADKIACEQMDALSD